MIWFPYKIGFLHLHLPEDHDLAVAELLKRQVSCLRNGEISRTSYN